jgi:cytoskeletal protein CcmA (bactofilin family)
MNAFKIRSKNSKSTNRLNLTPRSASTVTESFDSTKGKERSAYSPPLAANFPKSTSGESNRKVVSSSALNTKVETSAIYQNRSPVAPKAENNPFLNESLEDTQSVIPEPEPQPTEITTASYTQNAFEVFQRSESKPSKPVVAAKSAISSTSNSAVASTSDKPVKMYKPSIPEPRMMAPTVKPKDMPKAPAKQLIVGSGVMVNADITQADVVLVEGTIKGTIAADCLMILDGGIFQGEATCRVAYIAGIFSGPKLITSEKLQVGSTGKITASISYNVISMESGSVVTGMLTHVPPPVPEPEPVVEELPTVVEEVSEDGNEEKKADNDLDNKEDGLSLEKVKVVSNKEPLAPPLS